MTTVTTPSPKRTPRVRARPASHRKILSLVFSGFAVVLTLSFASFHPLDRNILNMKGQEALNWLGAPGAELAAIGFTSLGVVSFGLPVLLARLAWRQRVGGQQTARIAVPALLLTVASGMVQLLFGEISWRGEQIAVGGSIGGAILDVLTARLSAGGAFVILLGMLLLCSALVFEPKLGERLWARFVIARARLQKRRVARFTQEQLRRKLAGSRSGGAPHRARAVEEKGNAAPEVPSDGVAQLLSDRKGEDHFAMQRLLLEEQSGLSASQTPQARRMTGESASRLSRGAAGIAEAHPSAEAPRVFISYSHDTPEHGCRVLALADRLRREGIDAQLDQYEEAPPQGWQLWMEDEIESADFVIVVATEGYERRRRGREEKGTGLGVRFEGALLLQKLYDQALDNETLIPVVFSRGNVAHIPAFLKATTNYDLSAEGGYEALYCRLTKQPKVERPLLGKLQELPPKQQKSQLEPDPSYTDAESRELAQALDEAYKRHEELTCIGEDTSVALEEILKLRRRIRQGGVLKPGDFLSKGRFRLLEPVGRGGFSTVFKAYDRKLHQPVAIKVLHGQYAEDRSRRERFFRGARKMTQLQHQAIVRVIEPKLEDGGYYFFVMDYAEGGDLHRAVLDGRVKDLGVLSQVAVALDFAHQSGVVHRDVKPANILLTRDGDAMLTDFDLVRAFDTTGGTRTGTMLGTFLYMAPEAMQQAKDVGGAADIYSLAITAAFVLYGRELPPTMIRDPGGFIKRLDTPPAVKRMLAKATSWKPQERPSSALGFIKALAREQPNPLTISFRPEELGAAGPPPVKLLYTEGAAKTHDNTELVRLGNVIRDTAAQFGIEGTIEGIRPGPVITVYEFLSVPGTRVSRIVNLQDDLALALKAESVRIGRLPGRSTLGIEVPNERRSLIRLGSLLAREKFRKSPSPLTLALGVETGGEPYYSNLATMPHLLVTGASGSGKSVGLRCMITSILYKAKSDEVKFILIDSKGIEFGIYSDIPHLKTEVVSGPRKAVDALLWSVAEMERRYRLLAELRMRSIEYYNRAIRDTKARKRFALEEGESRLDPEELQRLPYFVIVIDELADLAARGESRSSGRMSILRW